MKTSVVVSMTKGGKVKDTTFSSVNPNIKSSDAKTFGQMIAALSTNTYKSTTRINKINCDEEDDSEGELQKPTLEIGAGVKHNDGSGNDDEFVTFAITYDGDGSLSVLMNTAGTQGEIKNETLTVTADNPDEETLPMIDSFEGKVIASEGSRFEAAEKSFSFKWNS